MIDKRELSSSHRPRQKAQTEMDNAEVTSSVKEIQEWVRRIKRGIMVERGEQRADPRIVDMLIENLESEVRKLAQLVNEH